MPISAVKQSDTCVCVCVCIYIYKGIHIFLFLYHHPWWSIPRDWIYTSMCYTVGPHWLSILNVIVCIYKSQLLGHPTPLCSLPATIVFSLCLGVCFCFVERFISAIFWIPNISDIIWYLSFSFWLFHSGWESELAFSGPRTGPGGPPPWLSFAGGFSSAEGLKDTIMCVP